MDFSNFPLSDRFYGGSEKKIGIMISGCHYLLKFQKRTAFGMRFNHVSEYIGSHIFDLLGFTAQETYLGTYHDEQVVACKDFNIPGEQFVPFNDVGESTLDHDKERYQYEYEDIMQMLQDNSKLTHVEETISEFWRIFIVDALLGNFDRHGSNWGFIKKDYTYSLAPVFDNGSCLYPNLTDEDEMQKIILSQEETEKRIFLFPTSQIKLNRRKSSYYDIIHSLSFNECNNALSSVIAKIDMAKIIKVIDETPMISDLRKAFYRHMINARYMYILKDSFDLLVRS